MRSHYPGLTLAALHVLIVVWAAVRTSRPKLRAMPHSAPRARASIIFAQSIPRRAPTATPERSWALKAFKYYYIPSPPIGLAGIVVEPTEDLHRLQDELIKAVEPYTVKTMTAAACYSYEGRRDIQPFLIGYVENFVRDAAGKSFNPHVTIGVATEKYLNGMLAEPFPSFTFWLAGASIYQLGSFGTARKELRALTLSP
jgi:hypothetical protein